MIHVLVGGVFDDDDLRLFFGSELGIYVYECLLFFVSRFMEV